MKKFSLVCWLLFYSSTAWGAVACLCCQSTLLSAPFLPNCFPASWHHTAQLHGLAVSWGQNFAFAFVEFRDICVTIFQGDLNSLENNSPTLWTAPWFGVILKSRRVRSISCCNKRYWRISAPLWGFKESTSTQLPVELCTGGHNTLNLAVLPISPLLTVQLSISCSTGSVTSYYGEFCQRLCCSHGKQHPLLSPSSLSQLSLHIRQWDWSGMIHPQWFHVSSSNQLWNWKLKSGKSTEFDGIPSLLKYKRHHYCAQCSGTSSLMSSITECMLRKFPGDRKLRGMADIPDGGLLFKGILTG